MDNLIYRKKLLENGIVDYIMRVWNELLLTETCKHNLIELVLALSQEKKLNAIYYQEVNKNKFFFKMKENKRQNN